jgi:hypothetical protein
MDDLPSAPSPWDYPNHPVWAVMVVLEIVYVLAWFSP